MKISIGTRDYKQGDLESDEYHPKKALSLADSESPVILPDKYTHTYTIITLQEQILSKYIQELAVRNLSSR